MPDLLLELFSEEIPARMQRRAAEDLKKLVTDALVERGFLYEAAKAYATPRRLALHVVGLPPKGKDVREERKGPRVGAPEKAIEGFLKTAGLASLDQARIEKDPKKGEFYVAVIERPGRPTPQVLSEILPAIIRDFPWPKSMRWGAASREPGSLRWVRPLHAIVCTFGPETETPEVVAFAVDGVRAGDVTQGHRFMAPEPIQVRRFADYVASLQKARVVLDAERRKDIILNEAKNLAFAKGVELVEDEGLLEEVAGLVEWPVVLIGSFEEAFLDIPPEVIRATIRANQKCFVLRTFPSPLAGEGREGGRRASSAGGPEESALSQPQSSADDAGDRPRRPPSPALPRKGGEGSGGDLANAFILVANLDAKDGGAAIVAGNERVVRARLSDAKFFWETDKRIPLEDRLEKLKSIVFHEKLGTQYERVERIAALAKELAPIVGADPQKAERAARLAKADLVTEMVGEFPELQGLMGRYYALAQPVPEDPSVAAAIEEHYKPLGPSDRVPTDPVSVAVALADKLDTLVGFWAIDEKPTGSKDPYALRRAALGVIRLVLDNELRLPLRQQWQHELAMHVLRSISQKSFEQMWAQNQRLADRMSISEFHRNASAPLFAIETNAPEWKEAHAILFGHDRDVVIREFPTRFRDADSSLLSFFADRLKVYLREQGARHDLIDAVFALASSSPLAGEADSRSEREGGRAAGADAPVHAPAADAARSMLTASSMPATPTPNPSPQGGGEKQLDDLLMIVRRVEALGRFLDTEDGEHLLTGYRRAANILRIEEKKDGRAYDGEPDRRLIHDKGLPEEKVLFEVLEVAARHAREHVLREDFEGAMRALAELRPAVDAFFDKVTVNTDDAALRENRLKLLNALRAATREVADFSKIEG